MDRFMIESTDIQLERDFKNSESMYISDIMMIESDDPSSGNNYFRSIVKFFKSIFTKILGTIEDIKNNEYPASKKKSIHDKLIKIYANLTDGLTVTLPCDYEEIEDISKDVIWVCSECLKIITKAMKEKSIKNITKMTSDVNKKVEKLSNELDKEFVSKEYRAKTICGIADKYVQTFPSPKITDLEKLCRDVELKCDEIETRLDAPVNQGIIFDVTSTKDLHDCVLNLSHVVRKMLKVYRATYKGMVNTLIKQYDGTIDD